MEQIKNTEFEGERPLFASHDLYLENVTVHAGESALKECSHIEAVNCRFEGKYPFWHNDGFVIRHCLFTEGARAALWYSRNLEMSDTVVDAPKMFREMENISLKNVQLTDAAETLWHCRKVELKDVRIEKADYLSCIARISVSKITGSRETIRSSIAEMWRYAEQSLIRKTHSGIPKTLPSTIRKSTVNI